MPLPEARQEAMRLEQRLRALLDHEHVRARPHGRHLVIDMVFADGETSPVARLTRLGPSTYGVGYRNHQGRWEPLPGRGSLDAMAELVVTALGVYLDPANY